MALAAPSPAPLRDRGLRTVQLIGVTPFYLGADANPSVALELLQAIDRGLGASTPLGIVRREATQFLANVGEMVAQAPPLQQAVGQLETRYDANRTAGGRPGIALGPVAPELPAAGEVVADVEDFLRQSREDPSGAPLARHPRRDHGPGRRLTQSGPGSEPDWFTVMERRIATARQSTDSRRPASRVLLGRGVTRFWNTTRIGEVYRGGAGPIDNAQLKSSGIQNRAQTRMKRALTGPRGRRKSRPSVWLGRSQSPDSNPSPTPSGGKRFSL